MAPIKRPAYTELDDDSSGIERDEYEKESEASPRTASVGLNVYITTLSNNEYSESEDELQVVAAQGKTAGLKGTSVLKP